MFWRKPREGANISGFAQETMCYMGQHLVFSDAEEVVNNLTGAGFNAKQIERVCHRYGQYVEDRDIKNIEVNGYEDVPREKAGQLHYVGVDGSMYLTREESWKGISWGVSTKKAILSKPAISARSWPVPNMSPIWGEARNFYQKWNIIWRD